MCLWSSACVLKLQHTLGDLRLGSTNDVKKTLFFNNSCMLLPAICYRGLDRLWPYNLFFQINASCQIPIVRLFLKLQFWHGCQNRTPSKFQGSVWLLSFWFLQAACLPYEPIKKHRKKLIQYSKRKDSHTQHSKDSMYFLPEIAFQHRNY